jgi:predicted transcriptional regulator
MRREHASILTDVLDALDTCHNEQPHDLHITQLATRANLPHDRLKGYLAELVRVGLLYDGWPATLTPRGQQFLLCYHSWLRLQASFGLRPAGKSPLRSSTVSLRLAPAARLRDLSGPAPLPTALLPTAPLPAASSAQAPSSPDGARPGFASA